MPIGISKKKKKMIKEENLFRYGVKIFTLGSPELQVRCSELTKEEIVSDPAVQQVITVSHQALRNFRKLEGFGRAIAAPQVGFLIRMIAMNLNGEEINIFNPTIIKKSDETITMWDDCLSFPDLMCCVRRNKYISVQFLNSMGELVTWNDCDTDISELLQHEIDHLDGILATERAVRPTIIGGDSGISCEAIVDRSDWLLQKEKYNRLVDFHY